MQIRQERGRRMADLEVKRDAFISSLSGEFTLKDEEYDKVRQLSVTRIVELAGLNLSEVSSDPARSSLLPRDYNNGTWLDMLPAQVRGLTRNGCNSLAVRLGSFSTVASPPGRLRGSRFVFFPGKVQLTAPAARIDDFTPALDFSCDPDTERVKVGHSLLNPDGSNALDLEEGRIEVGAHDGDSPLVIAEITKSFLMTMVL